ncbi:MAG: GNAT family N-acetyltransferase [Pseudohongiellaceae bacterium]
MLIRKTRSEDRQSIFQLHKNVARVPGGLARLEDEVTPDYVDHFVERAMRDGVALVAESANGDIVGELHACSPGLFCFSHVLNDLTVAVAAQCRQQGIARKLFEMLFVELAQSRPHITRVELIARESNTSALRFYESLGFVQEGRFEKRIRNPDGSTEADIPMAWHKAE